jgi:hypothetical protein
MRGPEANNDGRIPEEDDGRGDRANQDSCRKAKATEEESLSGILHKLLNSHEKHHTFCAAKEQEEDEVWQEGHEAPELGEEAYGHLHHLLIPPFFFSPCTLPEKNTESLEARRMETL